MDNRITEIRKEIDRFDDELLGLLIKRLKLGKEIGEVKREIGKDDTNFLSWAVDPILSKVRNMDGFIKLQERMEKIIQRERVEAGLSSS